MYFILVSFKETFLKNKFPLWKEKYWILIAVSLWCQSPASCGQTQPREDITGKWAREEDFVSNKHFEEFSEAAQVKYLSNDNKKMIICNFEFKIYIFWITLFSGSRKWCNIFVGIGMAMFAKCSLQWHHVWMLRRAPGSDKSQSKEVRCSKCYRCQRCCCSLTCNFEKKQHAMWL